MNGPGVWMAARRQLIVKAVDQRTEARGKQQRQLKSKPVG
jgi:hypothetical protein